MDSEEDSLDEQERDNLMIRMMQQNWSHLQESDSLPLINLPDDVIPTKDSAIDFSELPSFSKRYYVDVKDSLCIFCKQKGHEFKNCKATSIDCYICRKNHDISKCPLSVSCFKCGNLGHRISDCTASNDLYCSYCERETHHMHDCPWVWRQYVFKDDAVSDAHSYKISCYNCGQAHFGDHCPSNNFHFNRTSNYNRNSLILPEDIVISQKSKKNRKHDKPKRVIERQHRDARAKKENKAKKDNGFVYVPDKGIVPKFEQKSKDKQWENDINDHMYEAQKLKTDGYRDRKSNDDAQKHKTDRYDRKSSDFIDYVPKRYSDYKSSDYLEDAQKNKPDRYRDNDRKYSDYKSSDRYLDNDRKSNDYVDSKGDRYLDNDRKSNDYVESKADRYRDYDRKYSDNRRDSGDYPSKSGKYRENKIDYGYDDVSYTTRR